MQHHPAPTRDDPARTAAPKGWSEQEETNYHRAFRAAKKDAKAEAVAAIRATLAGKQTGASIAFKGALQVFDKFDLGEILGDITHTDHATLLAATYDDEARAVALQLAEKLIDALADSTAEHVAEQEVGSHAN